MVRSEVVEVTVSEKVPLPRWRLVYSRDYPDARTYRGKCTHEDCAFLVDPLKLLFEDWEKWAGEVLPGELEAQFEERGVTPLRLKVYVGAEPVLWGLAEYPAVRVESWHHGSPDIVLILKLVIGVVLVVWAFLAWLFHRAKEVDWRPFVIPIGLIGIGLIALALKPKKVERRR